MNYESVADFISTHPSIILLLAITITTLVGLLTSQYTDKCANLLVELFNIAFSHPKPPLKSQESPSSIILRYSVAKMIILSFKWFINHLLIKLLPDTCSVVLKNNWIRQILAILPGYQTMQEKISQIEDEMTDKLAHSLMFPQNTKETSPEPKRTYLKKLELYRLHHALENAATRFKQMRNKENLQRYQAIFLHYQTLYDEILDQTDTHPNAREWRKYRDALEYHRHHLG